MSELVILANEQNIYADSVAYLCNGGIAITDVEHQTTTQTTVEY